MRADDRHHVAGREGREPEISIVIPAYNEIRRLPATLRQILDYMDRAEWCGEVIVSDDGSTDGTEQMVGREFPECRMVRSQNNAGKGNAVRQGMLAARGRLRLFTDADLSTPIDELEGLVGAMEAGRWDVAIASRALPGSRLVVPQPWWREMSGRMFNAVLQPMSGLRFKDTQCGFKLFRREAAEAIFSRQQSTGWAFDVEVLMIARALGLRVGEHPVRWMNNEASKVSLVRDAPRMLRDILIFRCRQISGRYTKRSRRMDGPLKSVRRIDAEEAGGEPGPDLKEERGDQ